MSTTYQELEHLYKTDGHAIVVMALNILHQNGAEAIKEANAVCIPGNIFSEEYKTRCFEIAKMMANTEMSVLGAFVQRVVAPFTDVKGDKIPHLHPYGDEDGICPICGGTIEYLGDRETDDFGTVVSWECPSCGASGKSGYDDSFNCHYNVTDKEGKTLPERADQN